MTTHAYPSPLAALNTAIANGGGIVAFAKSLDVSNAAVTAWRKKGHVPFPRAFEIEDKFGVPAIEVMSREFAALEARRKA